MKECKEDYHLSKSAFHISMNLTVLEMKTEYWEQLPFSEHIHSTNYPVGRDFTSATANIKFLYVYIKWGKTHNKKRTSFFRKNLLLYVLAISTTTTDNVKF